MAPLGHWLFALPDAPQSSLGPDGRPARGGFFPPIDQPRRMRAGGRVGFLAPIAFGTTSRRRTKIRSIEEKEGEAMTLLTLLLEIFADEVLAIREEQNLVFLHSPLYAGEPLIMARAGTELWVKRDGRIVTMTARVA